MQGGIGTEPTAAIWWRFEALILSAWNHFLTIFVTQTALLSSCLQSIRKSLDGLRSRLVALVAICDTDFEVR